MPASPKGDFSVGVKWRLLDHASVLGDFAILPSIKLPTGSENRDRGTGTTDLSLLAISSHSFGPVSMDLNLGYTRRSGDGSAAPKSATLWTASFGFPVAGKLGGVAELYGYPRTTGPAGQAGIVAFLTGPTYQVAPYLAIDAGVILRLTGPQPRAFYTGPAAARFLHRPGVEYGPGVGLAQTRVTVDREVNPDQVAAVETPQSLTTNLPSPPPAGRLHAIDSHQRQRHATAVDERSGAGSHTGTAIRGRWIRRRRDAPVPDHQPAGVHRRRGVSTPSAATNASDTLLR